MKKLTIIITLMVLLCMALSGCGEKTPSAGQTGNSHYNSGDKQHASNNLTEDNTYDDSEEDSIKDPVVDWWKVYKDSNKTNCVTLQVSNSNSFPIGFNFVLVFYKDNEVVKTEDMWAVTCVEPDKPGIIYGDIDIPSSAEVDRVELENIEASKFAWKVLDSKFTKSFIDNGKQYFNATFSDTPRQTEIWVALYNDKNGDKKVQKDEFVQMGLLAPFVGIYEKEGEISVAVPDDTFSDYQIYCLAFSMDSAE